MAYWRRSGAEFSSCRTWRYLLWRCWDEELPLCNFILLNPSTADERENDPTVSRCIKFAVGWQFGGLVVSNLFAFRATKPVELKAAGDPVGPENDFYIKLAAKHSRAVMCGWGNHGSFKSRSAEVLSILRRLRIDIRCLKQNASGEPTHPLYLGSNIEPRLLL
jgi:hypothetical protein